GGPARPSPAPGPGAGPPGTVREAWPGSVGSALRAWRSVGGRASARNPLTLRGFENRLAHRLLRGAGEAVRPRPQPTERRGECLSHRALGRRGLERPPRLRAEPVGAV